MQSPSTSPVQSNNPAPVLAPITLEPVIIDNLQDLPQVDIQNPNTNIIDPVRPTPDNIVETPAPVETETRTEISNLYLDGAVKDMTGKGMGNTEIKAVSYTHLTLPTKRIV